MAVLTVIAGADVALTVRCAELSCPRVFHPSRPQHVFCCGDCQQTAERARRRAWADLTARLRPELDPRLIECAAPDCTERFVPKPGGVGHRYCSPRCKKRIYARRRRATPEGAAANRAARNRYHADQRCGDYERARHRTYIRTRRATERRSRNDQGRDAVPVTTPHRTLVDQYRAELDRRVHELYLAAEAEHPRGRASDMDVVALHDLMVECDATCCRLVRLINEAEQTTPDHEVR